MSCCNTRAWPNSQELACGLLKQDSLRVNQACRANSLAIQTETRAPSPAASTTRTRQRPVQLRTAQRRDIPGRREIQRL
ncbi:hypothetical protein EYF80_035924 [Liparis tanakae]|uniref:Uncharacterized protein n=1 Tax=Liparis tanakae TaxID=230148 RepID=A0A4Z2GM32_9TELE|nr:hypothetical protein EYF80_035924 [Liparis tanakae]